ncbi:MAG: hypothetical protein L0H93_20505, partial [Nocardioides sp.]|nr:hypothetical protein [Nocardioides sp.]
MSRDTTHGLGGPDDQHRATSGTNQLWAHAVSLLHAQIRSTRSTRSMSELVDQFRPGVPKVVEDIVAQIQDEVPAYAGPRSGERGQLITMAVTAAINRALELIEGNDTSSSQVNDLFRQMGHGEAHDGNTLEPMQAALRIATHHCWVGLRAFANEHDLTGELLGELGDAMFGYIEHLAGQVAEGFRWGTKAMERDPALARTRLLDLMLSDRQPSDALLAEIRALATVAGWAVPDEVVVMSVAFHRSFPTAEWPGDPLIRIEESRALMVCAAEGAADLARAV